MTRHRSGTALQACGLLLGVASPGPAIQLREYSAARHDRFTGFPTAPAWNEVAWFGSRNYAGVGWAPPDTPHRQFALISPLHLLCATHYQPEPGALIRFLNTRGMTVERTVADRRPIMNELAQNTDLTLITLSGPLLPADRVPHFPYLNLATEADYLNTALVVFGWDAKAGRGQLVAFDDLVEPGVNLTRVMRFDYPIASGDPDDAYLETGDSGSPTFAVAGGRPALLGLHVTVDDDPVKRMSYDSFVPHYLSQLNAGLEPTGYQMTPAYPAAVTLTAVPTTTPATWRQASPGSCRFELTNTSAKLATNLAVELRFPPTTAPASLTAPGWIVTPGSTGEWLLRRATLPAAATTTLTADWLDLGNSDSLSTELTLVSDGSARQRFDFRQELAPSYAAWAAGLTDTSPAADPDADGWSNLLEYAFGGDPQVNSQTRPDGTALGPVPRVANASATVEFPGREDAALRGLSYTVEFSESLANSSWTPVPPPGYAVTDRPYDPPRAGWLRRSVSFDSGVPKRFCRVRIELNENP